MSDTLAGVLFLSLSILLHTAFGLIMKFSQEKGYSVLAVGAANYIVAAITALFFLNPRQMSHTGISLWLLSGAGGLGYLINYLLLTCAMRHRGIAIAMTATQVSMAMPVIVSIFLWHEHPNAVQAIGVLVSVGAVVLLAPHDRQSEQTPGWTYLVVPTLFLTAGATRVAQKALSEIGLTAQQPSLTVIWFGAAALFSVGMMGITGAPASLGEWSAGAFLGWVNLGGLLCLLRALKLISAVVAFPATSCLTIALISGAALVFWKERLGWRGGLGILAALVAVALVSMR